MMNTMGEIPCTACGGQEETSTREGSLEKKLISPIGAEVGKDNHSLWSSSKLIVEVIAVSDVVNHLFVCKARNQLVWQNCLGIATTPEKCKEYYKLHCVPMFS